MKGIKMWNLKNKIKSLERRIADLERIIQSQLRVTEQVSDLKISTLHSNLSHSLVAVQFQMPSHDWMRLEESMEWKAFVDILEEYQKQNNQMFQNKERD